MADYFTKLSFEFNCSPLEAQAILAAYMLDGELFEDIDWDEVEPELRSYFPTQKDFEALFDGDDMVSFGVDIERTTNGLWVHGYQPNLEFTINLLWNVLKLTLQKDGPIGFEWANDCSKDRLDAYGGGLCIMFPDHVVWENTSTRLAQLMEADRG